MPGIRSRSSAIASQAPPTQLVLHRAGKHWIALERDRFEAERQPVYLELTPGPRAPIVWHFRERVDGKAASGKPGRLLNVVGWLEGGMVSVSARGTLYLCKGEAGKLAVYLPDAPVRVGLGPKPPKTLTQNGRRKPLYPDAWPKQAVSRVIRHRFRTIAVLDPGALLDELRRT